MMVETPTLKFLTPEHRFLIYATGGAGKSTLIRDLAVHVWQTMGLKTRIVGADGGGNKPFQVLMKKGILDYWPIDLWDRDIWTTYDRATKGWWPEDLETPNSKLQPPYASHLVCPFCKTRGALVNMCPACKKAIPAGTTTKVELEPLNGFEKVGAYGFESIAAFGFNIMARLRTIEKKSDLMTVDDPDAPDARIAQSAQHHYGIAQAKVQEWVGNTRRLPVWAVAWSTLELRGGDDGYGKPVYGPALPGKKLTALCTPWFTDVLHLELEPEEKKDPDGMQIVNRVMYLADHYPPDTKPYGFKAKTSVPGMPTRILAPAGTNNMATYFDEVAKAYAREEKLLGL